METKRVIFIGIGSKKQQGKDTVAQMICDFLDGTRPSSLRPPSAVIRRFADPLKQLCCDVFGLSSAQCWGSDEEKDSRTKVIGHVRHHTHREVLDILPSYRRPLEEYDDPMLDYLTGREVLQFFGLALRKEYPGIWSQGPFRKIYTAQFVIIPDVRFLDEARLIQQNEGILVQVLRDGAPRDTHPSETALDDFQGWDLTIHNNSTLEDLDYAAKIAGGMALKKREQPFKLR